MSSSLEISGKRRTGDPQKGAACTRGNALYMRSKREQEREYMRTCRTMPVISFTSSELEDYQLQLVLRSVDQIASQFVHRLFFLAPPSSSSSSSSSRAVPFPPPPVHRTRAPFFSFLISLHIAARPREVVQPCATGSKDEEDATPKCHVGSSPNCRNRAFSDGIHVPTRQD